MVARMATDHAQPDPPRASPGVRPEIAHIEAFLAWREERLLATGVTPEPAEYAEHLRVADLEDRLAQIAELAANPGPETISLIAELADV